jgi:hypothetical protein
MSNPAPDLATQVRILERRSRLQSRVLLAAAVLALLTAFTPDGDTVSARRLQLVDNAGHVRAELGIDAEGSAGLFLRDAEDRLRASLTHDGDQTALYILDTEGTPRLGAAQYAHGGGGFALHGPKAKGAAVLYLKGDGTLTFYDDAGEVSARLPD